MRNYPNVTGKSPFYFSQRQSIFIQPRLISDSDNPIVRSSSHSTQTFMKIAAYNVENLFDRAKGLNDDSPEAGQVVKEEAELKTLFEKPTYTAANKKRILELLKSLGLLRSDEGPFILRKIRGQFIKKVAK